MPEGSVLTSLSFSAINETGRRAVRDLFDKRYSKGLRVNLDLIDIAEHRQWLQTPLANHIQRINDINPVLFRYFNRAQRTALHQELLLAFYHLSAQYQLDAAEGRGQVLQERSDQIKRCADLIYALRKASRVGEVLAPEDIQAHAIAQSDKHVKYLGLTLIAPIAADLVIQAKEWQNAGIFGSSSAWMTWLNGYRLRWVWDSSMLFSVFDLLSDDFTRKPQLDRALNTIAPITGYMSWILYYTRGGIEVLLMLKHTIKGWWMNEEEKQLDPYQQLKTQWALRKFFILNDLIWGFANMCCHLWLYGPELLGYLGNVVTVMLLLMDVGLTILRLQEEAAQHQIELARYEDEIQALLTKIEALSAEDSQKTVLLLELDALLNAKAQYELHARYKRYNTLNDLSYTIALVMAFSLMCGFFVPSALIATPTLLALGFLGGALCFTLNTIYATVANILTVYKSHAIREMAEVEYNRLLQQFKFEHDPDIKKQLYLQSQQQLATMAFQQEMAAFQKLLLWHNLIIDILIPPAFLASFLFLPFAAGVVVLLACAAIAVVTNHWINNQYKPADLVLPEFSEEAYSAFEQEINSEPQDIVWEPVTTNAKKLGFFNQQSPNEELALGDRMVLGF